MSPVGTFLFAVRRKRRRLYLTAAAACRIRSCCVFQQGVHRRRRKRRLRGSGVAGVRGDARGVSSAKHGRNMICSGASFRATPLPRRVPGKHGGGYRGCGNVQGMTPCFVSVVTSRCLLTCWWLWESLGFTGGAVPRCWRACRPCRRKTPALRRLVRSGCSRHRLYRPDGRFSRCRGSVYHSSRHSAFSSVANESRSAQRRPRCRRWKHPVRSDRERKSC